jgi:hypothetical protein
VICCYGYGPGMAFDDNILSVSENKKINENKPMGILPPTYV